MPDNRTTTWHDCPDCGTPLCSRTVDDHKCPEFGPKQLAELAELAEFAGLEKGMDSDPIGCGQYNNHEAYFDSSGKYVCSIGSWQPHKVPAHGDLVLRALVTHAATKHAMSTVWGWQKVLAGFVDETWNLTWRFDFWPAVCRAALAVKGDGI